MEASHHLILLGSILVLLSIFAGLLSARIGAPLLLVFLGLGMLAGEDGPGGLIYSDFQGAYTVGSIALAVILFEGGMCTRLKQFKAAGPPALGLATVGVLITTGLVGGVAWLLGGVTWIQALLMGAIVASTDAAAVFGLLRQNQVEVHSRVRATLEVESGINDPMAIFLTMLLVEMLTAADRASNPLLLFGAQMIGGGVLGVAGGYALLWVLRRVTLAPGLYPILALAGAMLVFALAQTIGGSGYLAVYLVGILVGNNHLKSSATIERFVDTFAWLSQIALFLLLGLLVTPHSLVGFLPQALVLGFVLMFIARPVATFLCLKPFGFNLREIAFVSWVGLRGAVPIFLALVPVLSNAPGGRAYFAIAFVVVITSLLIQGWTIGPAARLLRLTVPAEPPPPVRVDLELPGTREGGSSVAGYRIAAESAVAGKLAGSLHLPEGVKLLLVVREGMALSAEAAGFLVAGDYLMISARADDLPILDRLLGAKPSRRSDPQMLLGEFSIEGTVTLAQFSRLYGVPVPEAEQETTVAAYMMHRLSAHPAIGDRLRLEPIDLVVQAVEEEVIMRVGIDLEPERAPEGMERWVAFGRQVLALLLRLRRRLTRHRPGLQKP
jgi:cell volume regulation protein A